jgi:hypothetical protein
MEMFGKNTMNNYTFKGEIKVKRQSLIFIILIALLLGPGSVFARVTISAEVKSMMASQLQAPTKVYTLDQNKQAEQWQRLDTWFEKRLDLNQAVVTENSKKTRTSLRQNMRKNRPILIDSKAKKLKTLDVKKEFNVFYIKKLNKRSFVKEISVPAKQVLPQTEIIAMGKKFIEGNGFCIQTDTDKMDSPLVVTRKRGTVQPGADGTRIEQIISQRVVFKRVFQGYEVVNSKQSVEIHPESGEILGYKNSNWTPVKAQTVKDATKVALRDVVKKVNARYSKVKRKVRATKSSYGMYQTNQMLIPVMLVYIQSEEDLSDRASVPEEEIMIVSLAKDIKLKKDNKVVRKPTQ